MQSSPAVDDEVRLNGVPCGITDLLLLLLLVAAYGSPPLTFTASSILDLGH